MSGTNSNAATPAAPVNEDFVRAEHFRRQLETVSQNATLALFIMDEHQHCTYMNPAAERLTGFTLDEVRGEPLHDYVHHTHPDGTPYPLEDCPIDRAFPQNMREQGEEVFVHKDGHFYPVAFTASPILDGGKPVGTIIEVRDISDERREREEREALVAALDNERSRLATVFERAPALIATFRGPEQVVEMANPAFAQMMGGGALLGRPAREVLGGVAEDNFLGPLDEVVRTGQPHVATEVRLSLPGANGDGTSERFLNFVFQPLPGSDGRTAGVLFHGVDVTEAVESRRRVEEQARELSKSTDELQRTNQELAWERARSAAVIEHAPVGILIAEAPSGRIIGGNRRVEEIFRHPILSSESVEDYGAWVSYHADGRRVESHEYPLARVFATNAPAGPNEYHYERGDGTRAWVQITGAPVRDPDGNLTGGLVVIDDIDADKRAEAERDSLIAALASERQRLRELLQQAPALIAVVRGPELVYDLANEQYLRLVANREVLGRPMRKVFPELEGQGYFEMLEGILATGETVIGDESPVLLDRNGDGQLTEGFFNFVFQPIREHTGEIEGILIHAVEVTDQVRARQEVEGKAEQLTLLAGRLESSNRDLDQFAYAASHDLKAPLRGIANLATWIEEDLDDLVTPESREHLNLLRGRVHRMEGLIEGILEYSRAGRVQEDPDTVKVNDLLADVVDLLALPKAVDVRLPNNLPTLVTERLPLQQVFMNLISNAIKYNRSEAPLVEITHAPREGFHEFAVRDNGPGIAPQYHERIFGIFQTLQGRDEIEGTGIGLSLVRKLVESRGGRVWVESTEGEGATFRFLWPRGGVNVNN